MNLQHMNLIPIAFELTGQYDPTETSICPILAATQELGLEVQTVSYLRQDVRTVSSPEKLPLYDAHRMVATRKELWLARGTNHCLVPAKQLHCPRPVVEGEQFISRDMEEQSYCLVHVTHEQLLQLLVSLSTIAGKLVADSFRYSDPAILTLQVGG